MWSPVVTTVAPTSEPVTLLEAKQFCSIDATIDEFDTLLTGFITAARQQAEAETGTRFVEQTIVMRASSFADLASLPIGPILAISEIVYDDVSGVEQTLAPADYELAGAGLDQSIRPAFGVTWPTPRSVAGSIRITATAGYDDLPLPIWTAMLLMISDLFTFRETAVTGTVAQKVPVNTTVRAMLDNHRIWL